ncbi:CAMK protein kinase [Kwoniella mangroviensis CBS 10435]|uniref:non-specific serine/threonine protein kinase n=1 Tax=Kwoniella mangroviensis CBS 10435 TaxID=1331196 RepID=A0A1B9IEK3_9TREE|nr:CAMK protein kinase [Kwoniella mangroviensis CBS 10435]
MVRFTLPATEITFEVFYLMEGRGNSDLVVNNRMISNLHIRLYAVKTTTDLSLAIFHDTSSNGYIINGEHAGPGTITKKVGDKEINSRLRVLREGDVLQIPGYNGVFTYSHHPQAQYTTPSSQVMSRHLQLFPSSDPSLTLPIDPWIIHNYPLGNGTWGIVNIGTHRKSQNLVQVAIKTIRPHHPQREYARLVKFEIKVQRSCDHPNILKLLDYIVEPSLEDDYEDDGGEEEYKEGKIHVVLELVAGGDLWYYIDKHRQLQEDEVRWIGWQLISALKYLHEMGIVHRDVKPENILLHTSCAYPRILLADFGTATSQTRLLSTLGRHTGSHLRKVNEQGTIDYFPYDRLVALREEYHAGVTMDCGSRKEVGTKWWREERGLDIWATGVTLYLCAAYSPPYSCIPLPQESSVEHSQYDIRDTHVRKDKAGDLSELEEDIEMDHSPESDSDPFQGNRTQDLLDDDPIDDFPSPPSSIGMRMLLGDNLEKRLDETKVDEASSSAKNRQKRTTTRKRYDTPLSRMDTAIPLTPYVGREDTITPHDQAREETAVTKVKEEEIHQYDMLIRQIEIFKAMQYDEWPCDKPLWSEWSQEGLDFIDNSLHPNLIHRIESLTAHDHPWFTNNRDELEEIYQKVLVKGEVIRWLL